MNHSKHLVVGLTGGIGSGKSSVADELTRLNIDCIDVDLISKEIMQRETECYYEILARYGESILLEDKQLNRKALREIIFNDVSEKSWLESITHPVIHQLTIQRLEQSTSVYCVLVHPLLFETNAFQLCDYTISIQVSLEEQLTRVCERDRCSREDAMKIINSQLSAEMRNSKANYVFQNTGNRKELSDKVYKLHTHLLTIQP